MPVDAAMIDNKNVEKHGSAEPETDSLVIQTFQSLKQEAIRERDLFTDDWKNIENQVNCVPPESWDDKEKWQTQIYLPLQFKAMETAFSIMHQMIIGNRRWFGFTGVDKLDKQQETDVGRFFEIIFEQGRWDLSNSMSMQEAVTHGTCFLKMRKIDGEAKIDFTWEPLKECLFDPATILDWNDARYWIREYHMDLRSIIASPDYSKEGKDSLLSFVAGKSSDHRGDHIQIFSAEGDKQFQISEEYMDVAVDEFWGILPELEDVTIDGKLTKKPVGKLTYLVIANEHIILRKEDSDTDFIPVQRGRMKRKTDHGYGNGFLKSAMGLQDLGNSIVNLGLDSAKIAYLPIVKYESNAPANIADMDLRPLGKIEVKPGMMDRVDIHRFNVNAMPEVTQNLALIDQLHQEATGVSRQAQGTETNFGQDETLGQTEIKLQAVERRMLMIAKDFTEEYIIPVLRKVWKMVQNPKWIKEFQKLADDHIGFKVLPVVDDIAIQTVGEAREPRVNLETLGKLDLDFKPLGLVNFIQKTEILKRLENLLERAEKSPVLQQKVKVEEVFKRAMDLADIPEHDELMKTPQEIQAEQEAALQQLAQIQQQEAQQTGVPLDQGLPQAGGF